MLVHKTIKVTDNINCLLVSLTTQMEGTNGFRGWYPDKRKYCFWEGLRSNGQNTSEQKAKETKSCQLQELSDKVKSLKSLEIRRSPQQLEVMGHFLRTPA